MLHPHNFSYVAVDLNFTGLTFSNNTFDIIVMVDIIEHLISPLNLLRQCRRILRDGGELIVAVPNSARVTNRLRMLVGDPVDMLHWDRYGDEQEHLHWFTASKLRHLLHCVRFTAEY